MKRSDGARLAQQIDDRLRAACDWDGRVRVLTTGVDLSANAITDRVRECAEMSSLCLELAMIATAGAGKPDPDPT